MVEITLSPEFEDHEIELSPQFEGRELNVPASIGNVVYRDGGVSAELKAALLEMAEKVAYIDADGQSYYDDLYRALYPLEILTAVFVQGDNIVYNTDSLDSLKPMLTVTAMYSDGTSAVVTDYTLSGSLTAGTSVITASYGGKTATFEVTVTAVPGVFSVANTLAGCTNSNSATTATEGTAYSGTITADSGYTLTGATVSITMGEVDITSTAYSNGTISIAAVTGDIAISVTAAAVVLSSISAVYTQSGTVYDIDTLDSLKPDLVVTATYSDSSTATVPSADYTLSGTLTAGTSTITASYGGKTDTFTVTVTQYGTKMSYVYSDGDLIKTSRGANSISPTYGPYIDTSNSNRRGFVLPYGIKPYRYASSISDVGTESEYYPIPVPATATSVAFSITPSTMYVAMKLTTWNGEEYGTGSAVLDVGWKQGSYTQTVSAGDYQYLLLNVKYNSSGSSFPSEPTEFTVTFS